MFGFEVKTVFTPQTLMRAVDEAVSRSLSHDIALIVETAKSSIPRSDEPSLPGNPPHSATGRLPNSIDSDVGKDDAVAGPRASVIGPVGAVLEKGSQFRGHDYEARPFMVPALEQNIGRLGQTLSI